MAISYPSSLDDFTNPASGDKLNSPSHSQQHKNINDAVEALEAKVGADSSAVTTSHDYKIAQLESGKQATLVSGTNIKTINSTSLLGSGDITVGGTPGGSDTQVQFNDGGSFGGDAGLTYNKTTKALTIGSGTDVVPVNIGSYAKVESKLNPYTEQSCSLTSTQSVDIQLGSDGYFNIYDTAGNTIFFIGDSAGLLGKYALSLITGGSIYLSTITGGSIYLSTQAGINNSFGILDLSSINTSDKTFTFPNASGTIALTDNIPVKASGSDIDTGTNNTKFATAKAIKDSHNVPSVAPGTSGNVLTSDGTDWVSAAPSASASFWTLMPGSPTRTSNTTFTITGNYTNLIGKGMVIKWTESSTVKNAMVSIAPTYSSPNTTVTIIGDTMSSIDANSLKYAQVEARVINFAIAGTIGTTATDVANAYYAMEPMRVFGADLQVGTAGTTNNTTIDINKGGTTMFTTKPTLASTVAASTSPYTANNGTSLALNDKVTIDIDAVQSTPAVDLYIELYVWATRYNYLT